jgi:hypothetical protein
MSAQTSRRLSSHGGNHACGWEGSAARATLKAWLISCRSPFAFILSRVRSAVAVAARARAIVMLCSVMPAPRRRPGLRACGHLGRRGLPGLGKDKVRTAPAAIGDATSREIERYCISRTHIARGINLDGLEAGGASANFSSPTIPHARRSASLIGRRGQAGR